MCRTREDSAAVASVCRRTPTRVDVSPNQVPEPKTGEGELHTHRRITLELDSPFEHRPKAARRVARAVNPYAGGERLHAGLLQQPRTPLTGDCAEPTVGREDRQISRGHAKSSPTPTLCQHRDILRVPTVQHLASQKSTGPAAAWAPDKDRIRGVTMRRRTLLTGAAALLAGAGIRRAGGHAPAPLRRVRPDDPAWPRPETWRGLASRVGGRSGAAQASRGLRRSRPDPTPAARSAR